ncbi:hypothetical protein AJ87_09520 [Rhizobium yanglingense]|nr:hypothetical protein AJ87_09520 [Rhizobium yanglingense]
MFSKVGHFVSLRQEADDHVLCFAMIETAEAMANLDEIVTTPRTNRRSGFPYVERLCGQGV